MLFPLGKGEVKSKEKSRNLWRETGSILIRTRIRSSSKASLLDPLLLSIRSPPLTCRFDRPRVPIPRHRRNEFFLPLSEKTTRRRHLLELERERFRPGSLFLSRERLPISLWRKERRKGGTIPFLPRPVRRTDPFLEKGARKGRGPFLYYRPRSTRWAA